MVPNTVVDLEGFLWFLQKSFLKPEETLQDKFVLKLYKPTNLCTAIEANSYLETLEIYTVYIYKTAQVHFTIILDIYSYLHACMHA